MTLYLVVLFSVLPVVCGWCSLVTLGVTCNALFTQLKPNLESLLFEARSLSSLPTYPSAVACIWQNVQTKQSWENQPLSGSVWAKLPDKCCSSRLSVWCVLCTWWHGQALSLVHLCSSLFVPTQSWWMWPCQPSFQNPGSLPVDGGCEQIKR